MQTRTLLAYHYINPSDCNTINILIKYMFDYLFILCLLKKHVRQLYENIMAMLKYNLVFYSGM